MQVFKQYFRIVKKSALASILIYAVIFLIVTIIFSNVGSSTGQTSFETEKCNVAIINKDNSPLSANLENYIKDNSNVVKIKTDEEGIKDALFFRIAEVIITIPKNFGDSFASDAPLSLETQNIPDSSSSIIIKAMINNYLNTTKLYIDNTNNMDTKELNELVTKDLAIETKVNLLNDDNNGSSSNITFYFRYLPYPLLCMLILGISIVSNIFNSPDLKRRNLCSPISSTSFNLQVFLGDSVLALSTWALFMILALVMYRQDLFTLNGLFCSINSFIFTLVCLCLSFLIGNTSNKNTISPISNIVALGGCFLGGAFVPQQLLSETVKNIAIINPVYWYVNANDKLGSLSIFNMETLTPVFFEFLIQLAFAAVFLGIGLVVMKQRRTKC